MSVELLADIIAIDRDITAGAGSGPDPANLWRAGLHSRARSTTNALNLPQLVGYQTLLARCLADEIADPGARRGGRRLGGCSGSAPCLSGACPVCRGLGDAWLLSTCRSALAAKPHGWVGLGGIVLDEDPIGSLGQYSPSRLSAEFEQSLRQLGLDHLEWHGRFALSVQSNLATREDSITLTVGAVTTTGPYHDLGDRFEEQSLDSLLSFRTAVAVEAGATGTDDACRVVHHQWHVPTSTQQGCIRFSQLATPLPHDLPSDLRAIELELSVAAQTATWGYRDLLLPASAARFEHLLRSEWAPG